MIHDEAREWDVVIAGGGPVGLLLAILLGQQGRRVLVAERRDQPPQGSMAIGITPPSLEWLTEAGVAEAFEAQGFAIRGAQVFENGRHEGGVDFSKLPTRFRHILSLPQSETIRILGGHLAAYPTVEQRVGVSVGGWNEDRGGIETTLIDVKTGALSRARSAFLVGCDGARSTVRSLAGIRWNSRRYAASFVMADVVGHAGLGRDAYLYFGKKGSVESFPLPGNQRRWIVQEVGEIGGTPETSVVTRHVRERTGVIIDEAACGFSSRFQPMWGLAGQYVKGRVLLCGDAAHVMSPIGGQGMNTGFMDAAHLSRALAVCLNDPDRARPALESYARTRERAFRVAARRAEWSMWLGTRRGRLGSAFRAWLIGRILMKQPVRQKLAEHFAMLTLPGRLTCERTRP